MKPTYVMTITVGGSAVTKADLERVTSKRWARCKKCGARVSRGQALEGHEG